MTPTPTDPREEAFQSRVLPWLLTCFGQEIANDKVERNHRFIEEALELAQSTGCTRSEALQLVDYVFDRPAGIPNQEVGGVMVTLAALCLAQGLDMHHAGEQELARIWTKVEKIREKQAAKPKHSPLPAAHESTNSKLAVENAELRGEVAAFLQWLRNQQSWEAFWAEGFLGEEPVSQAKQNLQAIRKYLETTGHGLRFLAEHATLRAELEAEQAKRKDTAKDFETAFRLVRQENDRLSAELESARTQRDEWFKATKLITRGRDTALAAKDAAEKLIRDLNRVFKCIAVVGSCGKAVDEAWAEYSGLAPKIAALTPAPTQEPPAGEILVTTKVGGEVTRQHYVTALPPAGGVTISTVEKEHDHWKATAQLHYNARLELERERDRKGGDSPCAPSNEPTLPDLSKCASNSPADVQPEGRGEWMPIETAPKDGTKVLALFYEECVASAKWIAHEQGGNWYLQIGESKLIEPTHWQPLPPPPMLPTEGSGA